MWEFIDKIIYINLDHREDRREIMKKFFEEGKIPSEKIVRFSAIKRPRGQLGCVESHMEVLNLANKENWKNVLILEDDLVWSKDFEDNYKKLEELIKIPNWDVIMLAGWYYKYKFPKLFYANNCGAYLVNESYRNKLLNNRKISVNRLKRGIGFDLNNKKYNADAYWNELIKIDNWYGLNPCICNQIDGFSDICKRDIESSKVIGIFEPEIKKQVYG